MRPDADAKIIDGEIVIRLSLDTMAFAAERSPALESYSEEASGYLMPLITDREAFAKELVHCLNKESEDGSTMVTDMFDAAFSAAADAGAAGIVFPDEAEYPTAAKERED
ncbi:MULTISPECIES: hypothetical protein [Luteibacter]|uniref:hypothetical protein n=1 Tax=Luteibacter TaxID=242605 RepID=UPI00055E7E3C|nr:MULTISPECIES: hypothetical protein [unclassified Luteibacter]